MDTADKAVEVSTVPKKRGRKPKTKVDSPVVTAPKTEDAPSVAGAYRQAQSAKEFEKLKKKNLEPDSIVEKWYEIRQGHKVVLCKKRKSGSVSWEYIGSMKEERTGPKLKADMEEKQKTPGLVRTRI